MATYERLLKVSLPRGRSAFLWGPRKTGKSTYLKAEFPDSLRFDLLQTDHRLSASGRNPTPGRRGWLVL